MSQPGAPGRGRGPEPSGAAMSASRGGILVGAAVVVGILIFSVINRGGPSASSTPETTSPPQTVVTVPATNPDGTPATNPDGTPATAAPDTTDTTKAKKSSKGARSNDQVVVQVLNGSGVQNAATTRSNDLRAKGYQTVPAGNAPAIRDGTAVQCVAGYEKEAETLVTTLADLGVPATVEPLPDPLPTPYDPSANCFVVLGR